MVMWGGVPAWLITRYSEARALLNDPRLSKDQAGALALFPPGTGGPHASSLNINMLLKDPPDHTRLRRLVIKAFTAGAVQQLRPRIERIADELLDAIEVAAAEGAVDLMDFFAAPLPMRVIGELLGVARRRPRDTSGPGLSRSSRRRTPTNCAAAMAALTALLGALIASKRDRPGDDLLSALVAGLR